MAFNDYTDYDDRGLVQNTGIISVDTYSPSSNTISSSAIGPSSILNGPYVFTAASGITNYNYQSADWQNKRMDVRDNGKIPVDIWAMMYNNGVIDD